MLTIRIFWQKVLKIKLDVTDFDLISFALSHKNMYLWTTGCFKKNARILNQVFMRI